MHSFLELVLHLSENDGSTFSILICRNDLTDVLDPWCPSSMICGVGSPEVATITWIRAGTIGKVKSKATSVSLGITVRTWPGDDYGEGQLRFALNGTLHVL